MLLLVNQQFYRNGRQMPLIVLAHFVDFFLKILLITRFITLCLAWKRLSKARTWAGIASLI